MPALPYPEMDAQIMPGRSSCSFSNVTPQEGMTLARKLSVGHRTWATAAKITPCPEDLQGLLRAYLGSLHCKETMYSEILLAVLIDNTRGHFVAHAPPDIWTL